MPIFNINYREMMRKFICEISASARNNDPNLIIIANNGEQLLYEDNSDNRPMMDYISAINGFALESVFYGYNGDNIQTPRFATDHMIRSLNFAGDYGLVPMVIDYCKSQEYIDDSYKQNEHRGYLSYAADARLLNTIPAYPEDPHNLNTADITKLSDAKNFLYLINPSKYITRDEFLYAIKSTNHDIIFIDLFYGGKELDKSEVESLRTKANGGRRMVISYMSIGETAAHQYFWRDKWNKKPPSWIAKENPNWPGCYRVKFWDKAWHDIIYRGKDSYLQKILHSGFDGVFLDCVDTFEFFEEN